MKYVWIFVVASSISLYYCQNVPIIRLSKYVLPIVLLNRYIGYTFACHSKIHVTFNGPQHIIQFTLDMFRVLSWPP